MKYVLLIAVSVAAGALAFSVTTGATADAKPASATVTTQQTFQGKPIRWWAAHAVQARKDANARARTVKRLRLTLYHDPSVQESIALASIIYPDFKSARAWEIIKHESWMTSDPLHAYNRTPVNGCHATGLYQFLDCTFRSTPFGKAGMSIYSPYAQSLAAGWMHENGRGCEWQIGPQC